MDKGLPHLREGDTKEPRHLGLREAELVADSLLAPVTVEAKCDDVPLAPGQDPKAPAKNRALLAPVELRPRCGRLQGVLVELDRDGPPLDARATARDANRPGAIADDPAQLSDDGRHRVRPEIRASRGLEAVHRLDEPDRARPARGRRRARATTRSVARARRRAGDSARSPAAARASSPRRWYADRSLAVDDRAASGVTTHAPFRPSPFRETYTQLRRRQQAVLAEIHE